MTDPILLGDLHQGKKYQALVTTRSGLYRYAMNDIVEVTGWFNQVPTIRFVQKGKGVTNITGEKLYEHQVVEAVETVFKKSGLACEFYVMLADVQSAGYTLYLEQAAVPSSVSREVDEQLARLNVEYQAKRESGRLKPLRLVRLREGTAEAYRRHCVAKGQRAMMDQVMGYGESLAKFMASQSAVPLLAEDWAAIEVFIQETMTRQTSPTS